MYADALQETLGKENILTNKSIIQEYETATFETDATILAIITPQSLSQVKECIKIAFELSEKLNTQSVAFDFIRHNNHIKLIEISYCFLINDNYTGYWDNKLKWHSGKINAQYYIIEDFINSLGK